MALSGQIGITGGSGHLGGCIIQKLLEQKYYVKALYFNSKPYIKHKNLSWIQGNITNSQDINEFVVNTSVIIHCAGFISLEKQDKNQVYHINVKGTIKVIEACVKNKVKLIHISSSAAVKDDPVNEVFDENRVYKTNQDTPYSWTKALAEQKILNAVISDQLKAFIIRPTAIVGPPDFGPSHFGQTIKDMFYGKLPMITTGGYNIVDIRDLSKTIINSISKGKQGEIYLVGGHYTSFQKVAQLANPNRKMICISLDLVILFMPFIKLYSRVFPMKWHISKESLKTVKNAPLKVDSSKAAEHLNHHIRPISETINDLVEWFKNENKG